MRRSICLIAALLLTVAAAPVTTTTRPTTAPTTMAIEPTYPSLFAAIAKLRTDNDQLLHRVNDLLAANARLTSQLADARAALASNASPSPPAGSTPAESPSATPGDGTVYTGPRGGRYHISASGNKVYERHR